jgi:hypothetical protein
VAEDIIAHGARIVSDRTSDFPGAEIVRSRVDTAQPIRDVFRSWPQLKDGSTIDPTSLIWPITTAWSRCSNLVSNAIDAIDGASTEIADITRRPDRLAPTTAMVAE